MTRISKTTLCMLAWASITVPVALTAGEFAEAAVKANCKAEWGNDFSMQAYCVSEQKRGFDQIEGQVPALDAGLTAAFAKCEIEWAGDYAMQAYCLSEQKRGRASLVAIPSSVPRDVGPGILQRCSIEWPADFAMQAYCASQQVAGWLQVNQ